MRFQRQPDPTSCRRACYASLLDIPVESIPNFADEGEDRYEPRLKAWLDSRGFDRIVVHVRGNSPADAFRKTRQDWPGIVFLLGGRSFGMIEHCVLVKDGEIIWDPDGPDSCGIRGPCIDDGYYHCEFLQPKFG